MAPVVTTGQVAACLVDVDDVRTGRSLSRGAPLSWPAELVFRSPPSDVRACSVGEETSAMELLKSCLKGGKGFDAVEAGLGERRLLLRARRSAWSAGGRSCSTLEAHEW